MPNRRVFGVSLASADRPHHRLARIGPDPYLERRLAFASELLGVAAHVFLHPQRRVKRPQRMVLVGDRGAEQREDPIAGGLHNVAVIAMDRVDHELQGRIDNAARLLGVEVLHQLHRALDVGKQRRDRLALAIEE
jgi:hypothetical protein